MLLNQVLVKFSVESKELLLIVIWNLRDIDGMLPSGNHLNNLFRLNSLNALRDRFGWELHSVFKQMIVLSCLLVVLHLNLSIVVLYALLYWEKRAPKEWHLFHTILKTGIVCLLAILRLIELSIANAGVHLVSAKALSRVHCVLHVSFG
jgi:hypothetical protein